MKIKFCGAAGTVTGSNHLLTLNNGKKILLDCGMYQGNDDDFNNFNEKWSFEPAEIDVLVLSHAHIDHSGRIPKLVKDGFKGDIFCTNATRNLANIMLLDSAHIQEKDTEFQNKRRKDKKTNEPLYTVKDAEKAMKQFVGIGYDRWHHILKDVEVMFRDAGHILGSASVSLRIKKKDGEYFYFGFTGDIGRPDRPILKDPHPMPQMDYIICESTYGDKLHHTLKSDEDELLKIIKETCCEKNGKLIIPAFSVGRTQEIVYLLNQLENDDKLPKIPVFVDSPLAVNATNIFVMHPECFDDDMLEYMTNDSNPFGFNGLKYVRKVEESKAINSLKGPAIIISAAGMMQAGRVKHHIYNKIEDSNNTILVVGFCAQGTLGRRLRDGAKEVKIFGETKKVNARIAILDSFSAHGDQKEMIAFLNNQDRKILKKIFLVHGEEDRQIIFREALEKNGFRDIEIPALNDEFTLTEDF
jgi:metallo-beta-lactamase family protein